MKLFYCEDCHDVVCLERDIKACNCGRSRGKYLDNLKAALTGNCIPLGFDNKSFVDAIHGQPEEGMGKEFTAFVIPKSCDTITYY